MLKKNAKFWKTVGPYMNDKGSHGHDDYMLEEKGIDKRVE